MHIVRLGTYKSIGKYAVSLSELLLCAGIRRRSNANSVAGKYGSSDVQDTAYFPLFLNQFLTVMKNNKLHIIYKADCDLKKTSESMRCTSVKGAKAIIAKKNKSMIRKAFFVGPKGGVRNVLK